MSLPFNGVVVTESVDVGQFVGPGNRLATVYGTDVVEVRVPLDSADLAWFDLPSRSGRGRSRAEVTADFGGMRSTWNGRVTRMEAQVDETTRMVHVVVEIDDPYDAAGDRPALLPGTFVDVRILGRTLNGVVPVPRYAVREGDTVWVFDDGHLAIRDVEILRSDRERSLVRTGLGDGDLVILSALDAVTDGMVVRDAANQGELVPEDPEADPSQVTSRLDPECPPSADAVGSAAARVRESAGA